MNKNPYPISTE